jgi:polysaccharide biosynthesis PFTS motif protein
VPPCLFLLFQLREEGFVLEGSLKIIYYYVRWSSFAARCRIDHLITHADFNTQTIARNIILEKHGCRSHYYLDSVSLGYISFKDDVNVKHRHNLFGFLYYDSLVSWCDKAHDYFEQSGCKFKHYVNLGCFWAEHLRLIQEGKIKSDLKKKLYLNGYKENMKLISVFDSTFNDDSLTTYIDGIGFLEKILRLLNDLPDIFVILKEKKPREFHSRFTHHFADILRIYTKLENHERCYCVNNHGNSSDVIAFSDLTVSFPFTSTTFEALSARKKAIWYDATGKFRGAFYDDIPGLICHNYQELITRVKELLFNISEEEYNNYLDRYVKGNLELYLDGRAISRFREYIAGSDRDAQCFSLREEVKSA